jgi:hypothetical protein
VALRSALHVFRRRFQLRGDWGARCGAFPGRSAFSNTCTPISQSPLCRRATFGTCSALRSCPPLRGRAPFGSRAALYGGFHLAPHKEDYLRQTMKELADLDVDYIVPMHCTGEPFYEMLKAELPKKVIRSYTGTKLVFGT